jgi:hypothetical protein
MILRRAFYRWQFLAAVILPAWVLIGWGIFGSGGWTFLGLLILCPVLFVALGAVAGIIFARGSVRADRAVSWRDVALLAAWHAAIVGFGFFGPATGWFAVLGILIGLAALWTSVWELITETSRRLKETLDAYQQAANPQQVRSPRDGFEDGGEFIVIEEGRHYACYLSLTGQALWQCLAFRGRIAVCAAARFCHRGTSTNRAHHVLTTITLARANATRARVRPRPVAGTESEHQCTFLTKWMQHPSSRTSRTSAPVTLSRST